MVKKLLALTLSLCLAIGAVGCSNGGGEEASDNKDFKVGIVTPTLSVSEDEYRGAEAMVEKYPGQVEHVTLPENFNTEIETAISQIVSLADDEQMKAIVVVSGQSGLLPALQQVKEKDLT